MTTYKDKYEEEIRLVNLLKGLNDNADNDDTDIVERCKYFLSQDRFSIHDTYTPTYYQSKVDNFNIDRVFPCGKTLLRIAVESRYEKVVNALLEEGANANIQDKFGRTPIYVAATLPKEDSLKLGELLLKNEANPNLKDIFGHSPLYYALKNKNLEMAKLLVDNGADQSCIHKPKAIKIGISAGLLFAVTPLILIYFTQLIAPVMIIATVSSALIIGSTVYGAACMWSEHLLTSKLREVDNCSNLVFSVER